MPRAGRARWVDALLGGEARAAFCGTRPPGHHARNATTSGFCLFNNVAVAARHALDACGARRVFILDWDVHHGDGTNDIFRTSDEVLFASIHQAGIFPGTGPLHDVGSRAGEGFSINLPVPPRSDADAWISLLEHVAVPAASEFGPDLVLISAGFDAHRDDSRGGCELDTGSYAEMARHLRVLGEEVGAPVGERSDVAANLGRWRAQAVADTFDFPPRRWYGRCASSQSPAGQSVPAPTLGRRGVSTATAVRAERKRQEPIMSNSAPNRATNGAGSSPTVRGPPRGPGSAGPGLRSTSRAVC